MEFSQINSNDKSIEYLKNLLMNVLDSYYYFVLGVITDCKRSKKKYHEKCSNVTEQIIAYIEEHPKAKSSEIIEYTSNLTAVVFRGETMKGFGIDGMRLLQKNKQSKSSKESIATTDA